MPWRRGSWMSLALPLLLFVAAYLLPLGGRPLAAPDELRYAEIPREMIASGDWVVPHLDGMPYFEKPALGYWTTALTMRVLGETTFAVRLPSALAAGLMALIVGLLAARAASDRRVGALAAAGLLSFLGFHAFGTLNLLDAQFSAWVSASLGAFFMATESTSKRAERRWLAFMGVACGLAFLTKGFLAFALPVLVAAPYMLWQRRFPALFRMCWIPIAAAAAVSAPWAMAIALREPEYWPYFLFVEHLQRFSDPGYRQHEESWYYYVPVLLACALPWSALVPAALRGGALEPRMVRFATCWLVFPFLFFSISSGKLYPYVLPCLPPLALLLSTGAWCALERGRCRTFQVSAYVMAALLALAGTVLGVALVLDRAGPGRRLPLAFDFGQGWRLTLPVAGLLFACAGCLVAARRTASFDKLGAICVASLGLLLSVLLVIPAGGSRKFPQPFLELALADLPHDALLVSQDRFTHAVCFALRRDDVVVIGEPGEFSRGLGHGDGGEHRIRDVELLARIADPARIRPLVLVVRDRDFESFFEQAPSPTTRVRFDDMSVATFAVPDA